ncbi:MAG TPA: hypothetical protein VF282_02855, partial [Bacillota bacterium]
GHRPEMPAPPHRARPLHQMPVTDIAARLGYGMEVPPDYRTQAPPEPRMREARTQVRPEPRKEDRTGDHGSGR